MASDIGSLGRQILTVTREISEAGKTLSHSVIDGTDHAWDFNADESLEKIISDAEALKKRLTDMQDKVRRSVWHQTQEDRW